MRLLLNVGTEPGEDVGPDMGHDARAAAIRAWVTTHCDLMGWDYDTRNGEATIVLDVKFRSPTHSARGAIMALSEATQQDCIAVWNCEGGAGTLIGPRTEKWHPFDAAKFKFNAGSNRVLH